jgi:hypothetical protein
LLIHAFTDGEHSLYGNFPNGSLYPPNA